MVRPYITKWFLNKGDRFIGARVVKYAGEAPTIDIYWWWGGIMIWFGNTQPRK